MFRSFLILTAALAASASSDARASSRTAALSSTRVSTPHADVRAQPRPSSRPSSEDEDAALDPAGRAWSPFPFPYWGPQGVIIGPPWFGAGVGGGNWRVIPNRTPFGPPGALETHLLDGDLCDFDAVHSARAALAAAPPFEPVPVCSGFPCEVYTCRLGTNTTHASTLMFHKDDAGNEFARLRCFKLLDDFEETGCREWDRLKLNRRRTDKRYDCALPWLSPGEQIDATPDWTNDIEHRRSKLECVGRLPDHEYLE
jgi:hypothetical protein